MASFIQGKYTKTIFMSGTGYYIGLFKVSDVSDEKLAEYVICGKNYYIYWLFS